MIKLERDSIFLILEKSFLQNNQPLTISFAEAYMYSFLVMKMAERAPTKNDIQSF